jgi:anti-sigma factor RsiW
MNEREHHLEWNDRLQDWLDGEPDASFEAHLAGCTLCQAQLADMQALDRALQGELPALSPSESFDARLFEEIDAIDDKQRLAAREQAERELQENLQALRRGWRRTLAFVIPGIVAGIAIAFALTTWLDDSGVARTVALPGAHELGSNQTGSIQMALTALLGAGIGMTVARWLSTVVD